METQQIEPEVKAKVEQSPEVENVQKDIRQALDLEFPNLGLLDKVDLHLLWSSEDRHYLRLNGWDINGDSRIVFSRFIIAWYDNSDLFYDCY